MTSLHVWNVDALLKTDVFGADLSIPINFIVVTSERSLSKVEEKAMIKINCIMSQGSKYKESTCDGISKVEYLGLTTDD